MRVNLLPAAAFVGALLPLAVRAGDFAINTTTPARWLFPPADSSNHTALGTCAQIAKGVSRQSAVYYPASPQFALDIDHYMTSSSNTPACVLEVGSALDAAVAIKIIGSTRTAFAVMSGGHASNPGWSSVGSEGVHISMARLREITLSADNTTVVVGPGNTWDAVNGYLDQSNVAVVGGRVPGVGVGGFILGGGGFSWVSNTYGMTIDTVVSFTLVLPNGTITTVDASRPDLFFALKGAGNKLGIVTEFVLKTYPSTDINGGLKVFGPAQVGALAEAMTSFQTTNKDPKAQVIATFNGIGLINTAVLIQFYNGANPPPGTFAALDAVLPLLDFVRPQRFAEFLEVTPANLSSGLRGSFQTISISRLSKPFMDQVLNQSTHYNLIGPLHGGFLFSYDIQTFLVDSYFTNTTDSAFPRDAKNPCMPLDIYFSWAFAEDDEFFYQALKDTVAVLEATANANGDDTTSKPLYPNYALADTPVEKILACQKKDWPAHRPTGKTARLPRLLFLLSEPNNIPLHQIALHDALEGNAHAIFAFTSTAAAGLKFISEMHPTGILICGDSIFTNGTVETKLRAGIISFVEQGGRAVLCGGSLEAGGDCWPILRTFLDQMGIVWNPSMSWRTTYEFNMAFGNLESLLAPNTITYLTRAKTRPTASIFPGAQQVGKLSKADADLKAYYVKATTIHGVPRDEALYVPTPGAVASLSRQAFPADVTSVAMKQVKAGWFGYVGDTENVDETVPIALGMLGCDLIASKFT
ncbi:hypothetical protein RQP46_007914 [Phenoliferia psychrophenolica]